MSSEHPTGQGPTASEGEPQPKGIRVKVEKPDLIFKAAQRGVSVELGACHLASPTASLEASHSPEKPAHEAVWQMGKTLRQNS
jgi:hypothetical protein